MPGLERTTQFLELLKQRLRPDETAEPDRFIESVIVNYLLTVAYSDLEQAVQAEVSKYASEIEDVRIGAFVRVAARRLVRSLKCNELSGFLGHFDEDCKRHFQEKVNNTPEQAGYDRVVNGRHDQSHSLGSELSLEDFERDLVSCEHMLSMFAEALRCACSHAPPPD